MLTLISFLLMTLAIFLAIPVIVLTVEIAAAIVLPRLDWTMPPGHITRRRIAFLVPAHNEGPRMLPTLADIKREMRSTDCLLVVADNCTDDTAAIAASAGAEVVIRNDPHRKGKGYALDWGVRHLSLAPPDVVVIVDADCRLAEGAIDRLEATCIVTKRPVQGLDLMIAPAKSPAKLMVAEFAWRLKNLIRPLGLRALDLPCQLMGTGMAFPWDVIRSVDLGSGSIVEDLKLGHDLALAGNPPVFVPFPTVTSEFPISAEAIHSQRLRWEQGHIKTILTAVPRMLFAAIARANIDLLALALDTAVPPLSLLVSLSLALALASYLATLFGVSCAAMLVSTVSLMALIIDVILCWWSYGREIMPPSAILSIVSYVFGKLPIYRQMYSRMSQSHWTRTGRQNE
jgi:cellulose synthase/poly-beta-1,6-N-acetylglucosamine synthase-like glycosyltransferase